MTRTPLQLVSSLALASCLAAPAGAQSFPPPPTAAAGSRVTVVASGLRDPRGLVQLPDGSLLVAEAGTDQGVFVPPPPPPPTSPPTRDRCEVYWPVGPATPGFTGRLSRIDARGRVTTVVDGVASFANNALIGGDRMGAAFPGRIGARELLLVAGGGCSHGHAETPSGIYQVGRRGALRLLANLSGFLRSQVDSKDPAAADFEADGTWTNLVASGEGFWSVEPNHGVLVRVDRRGRIERSFDLIAATAAIDPNGDGDKTFAALVERAGALYVGTLGRIDTDFAAEIFRVAPSTGAVTRVASGLHGVLGLAFDARGRLYALETTQAGVAPPLSDPTAGRLVRVEPDGSLTPIVTGLAFPAGLLRGSRGELYVSNCGYHCDDRSAFPPTLRSLEAGQVLRVDLGD